MTVEQKLLAIWGGSALIVLVAAWIYLSGRGDYLEAQKTTAAGLHSSYEKLYPDEGKVADEAKKSLSNLKEHQNKELRETEDRLVPELPSAYKVPDLVSAAAQVQRDLKTVKQRGESLKIVLPASLPFEAGVDQDVDVRFLQLAQLYLYRQVLDLCMNAAVSTVNTIVPGKTFGDPSGTYAVITCDFAIDLSYQSYEQLIQALEQSHKLGIGVRALAIDHDKNGVHMHLTASLLCEARPGWKLKNDAPRPLRGEGTPAGTTGPTRGRLGGG